MSRRSDAEKSAAYLFGNKIPSKHKLAKVNRARAKKRRKKG